MIIDIEKENGRIKKENDKAKNDIKAQYSNIEQISNELSDIKRQINYIKKNKRNELKEMINLYPKTFIDGIVDRQGNEVEVQEKLIAG